MSQWERKGSARSFLTLPPLAVIAILLLLAWTSVMIPGFSFPENNNIFHVPIVLDYAHSAEGPRDAFTRSLDDFVSAVWPVLRLVATEGNVFWVFFLAHFASRLLFTAGFYALVRHFSRAQVVALAMAGFAALAPIFKLASVVGRNDILLDYFSHTELAMAMMPAIWWLLVRGRWVAGAAMIGLMFNVNAFLSVWSVLAAAAAMLALRSQVARFGRTVLLCSAVFTVASLPTAVWTLHTLMKPSVPIDFRAYLLSYYPFHTFVHVQWDRVIRFIAYLIASGLVVSTALPQLERHGAQVLGALLASFLFIFLIAVPLPYFTGFRLILNLYPLRIDSVVMLLVGASTLAWAGLNLSAEHGERDGTPLAIALTLLVGNMVAAVMLLHLWRFRQEKRGSTIHVLGALIVMALLLVDGALPEFGKSSIPVIFIFCGVALCASFGTGRADAQSRWIGAVTAAVACSVVPDVPGYPLPLLGLALAGVSLVANVRGAATIGFAAALATCAWTLKTDQLIASASCIALTATGLLLAMPRVQLISRIASLSIESFALIAGMGLIGLTLAASAVWRGTVERPDAPEIALEREAEIWVRAHVPPETQILPVGVEGFGVLSRRPMWVEWKEGAAAMWDPSFLPAWEERMQEVRRCAAAAPCYAAVARQHGISWLVAKREGLSDPSAAGLQLVFQNHLYAIYRVRSTPPGVNTVGMLP